MKLHRFGIGQTVYFSPARGIGGSGGSRYTVTRLLPEEGRTPQYRIKSKMDGTERVVLESQLAPLAA